MLVSKELDENFKAGVVVVAIVVLPGGGVVVIVVVPAAADGIVEEKDTVNDIVRRVLDHTGRGSQGNDET